MSGGRGAMGRRLSAAALLVLAVGASAFLVRFAVLLPRGDVTVEPATFRAYRIDSDRTLLAFRGTAPGGGAWDPGVLVVNRAEQVVGVPSWYGRWIGPVLLWDRGSYAGVWLRDEVKMGRPHRYRFDGPRLEIDWIADDGRVKPIRVTFDR